MSTIYDYPEIYDLLENESRFETIKRHWEYLLRDRNIRSFLDVSIGTGNLTLPLCELGVKVHGSDLSSSMLEKCRSKGYKIELTQCDFRNLSGNFNTQFDCVGSTGNSLPYVINSEVIDVLTQMDALIHPGGWLYFDMRNWDKILEHRQRFYLYPPFFADDMRINLVQVWDYNTDNSMTFNLLYTFEKNNSILRTEHFEEHYYPISRSKLIRKLKDMNYTDISLYCHPSHFHNVSAESADWYSLMARKPL